MSYQNLRPANFQPQMLRGTGNIQAENLHSMVQCATQAELEEKAYCKAAHNPYTTGSPFAAMDRNWHRDHALRRLIERRGDRGGMNMTALDGYVKE